MDITPLHQRVPKKHLDDHLHFLYKDLQKFSPVLYLCLKNETKIVIKLNDQEKSVIIELNQR